jgi:GNAT superfamily N-acetyltransferase
VTEPKDKPPDLRLRKAEPDDRPAIIELCRRSLGWKADDPNEAFFAWKHDENPFGQSPAWVAEDDTGTLVGLRTFLRWRFRRPDGTTLSAVRAVDTATHPDWQGRGIFSRLTLSALDDLRDEGVDCVFNTPNDKSRPGYLKMGWQQVGKVPVSVRLTGPRSIAKLAGARTAAEKWSEECSVGRPAAEVFADHDAVEALLARIGTRSHIATDRTIRVSPLALPVRTVALPGDQPGNRGRGRPRGVPGPTSGHGSGGDDLRRAHPRRDVTETGVEGPQRCGRRLPLEGLDVAGSVAARRCPARLRAGPGVGPDPHLAPGCHADGADDGSAGPEPRGHRAILSSRGISARAPHGRWPRPRRSRQRR